MCLPLVKCLISQQSHHLNLPQVQLPPHLNLQAWSTEVTKIRPSLADSLRRLGPDQDPRS